ncbi:MAG: hypothetical protein K2I46_07465, partial [Clostridia bacterium]|nr:hypothetical protein [Clostridia bacterium]
MNSKTLRTKYLKSALLIITVCLILGAISACLPFNVSIPELNNNAISDTAVTITTNTSDGLGEFNNGFSYVFTDKNKVDGYRAGTEDYDMTSHKVVKTSGNRGSEDNPYVITNVTQWNSFASSATSASTMGKVYVLGQDIDFDGESFSAVESFNGKFYGIGHTLRNINKNFGSSNTCGIFREIGTESVVTDLNLDNVTLTTSGCEIGMLAGSSGGSILNCHVKGNLTGVSNIVGTGPNWTQYSVGGLIGDATGNNIKIYIYRCSVNVKAVVSTTGGSSGGGIIGSYNSSGGLSVAIYDCVAITDFTVSTSDGLWFGGITNYCNSLGEQAIENCAVYTKITCGSQARVLYAALTNGYPTALPKLTLKNIYCSATLVYNGSTTYNIPPALFFESWTATVASKMTLDCDNINWFADKTVYFSSCFDFFDRRSIANKKYTGATGLTQNDMYENLKSAMPSDIWAQKDVIDTAYMTNTDVTSTSGYTIDNSPVRNYLMAFIDFRNLNNGGNNEEKVGLE